MFGSICNKIEKKRYNQDKFKINFNNTYSLKKFINDN